MPSVSLTIFLAQIIASVRSSVIKAIRESSRGLAENLLLEEGKPISDFIHFSHCIWEQEGWKNNELSPFFFFFFVPLLHKERIVFVSRPSTS